MALSLLSLPSCRRAPPKDPVLVIGAGVAGLSAAARLRRAGLPVVVLEARDRVGGRVHASTTFAAHPIDLGAELMHGRGIATWELVTDRRARTRPVSNVVERHAGQLMPFHGEPSDAVATAFVELVAGLPSGADLTLAQAFERLEPRVPPEALRALRTQVSLDADLETMSARAVLAIVSDPNREGGDFVIEGGMSGLLPALQGDTRVRLGFVVEHIEVLSGGVRVTSKAGEVVAGSSAIVTLPLGVLRANDVRFSPPLPTQKREAIEGLGMAAAVKLFYRFSTPAVRAGTDALVVDDALPRFFWVGTFRAGGEQVVTGWATHDDARRLLGMGETAALTRGLEALRHALRSNVTPVSMRWSEWESQPFTRGAYSMTRAGGLGLRERLATPTEGRLFWAGEATALEAEASTVHGAFNSGRRAADELLRG